MGRGSIGELDGGLAFSAVQGGGDDERDLASSLELALRGCLAQLRTLRIAQAAAAESAASSANSSSSSDSKYAAEERALKLSLSGIVAQLQAVREAGQARRCALLLSAVPQALPFLTTRDALLLGQASTGTRTAGCARCSTNTLFVPNLDSAPVCPHTRRQFLSGIALGSVLTVALPLSATMQLLSEHVRSLDVLEVLMLPRGFQDFDVLRYLPSLQWLSIDASGCNFDVAVADCLARVLLNLKQAQLTSLTFDRLAPALATALLDAVLQEGRQVRRLVFRNCAFPDAAAVRICRALASGGTGSEVLMSAICFEDCELSDLAEQGLLSALEECDGRCVVTLDGGTTRTAESTQSARSSMSEVGEEGQEAGSSETRKKASDAEKEIVWLRAALAERDALLAEMVAALEKRDARILDLEERMALWEKQKLTQQADIARASGAVCHTAVGAAGLACSAGAPVAEEQSHPEAPAAAAALKVGGGTGSGGAATAALGEVAAAAPLGELLAVALTRLQAPEQAAIAALFAHAPAERSRFGFALESGPADAPQ